MEIEKTSKTNRREEVAFQDVPPVKENPSTSGNVNAGTLISRVNRTSAFSQKSHPPSPSKISEVSKPRESTPCQQSNSITNYFQVARKRYVEMFLTLCPLFFKIMLFLENFF